jgi:hypothetical protein
MNILSASHLFLPALVGVRPVRPLTIGSRCETNMSMDGIICSCTILSHGR